MEIRDSVALVTGANRGLGRAFLEELLARGAARVYAGARNPEDLAPLLSAHGAGVVPLTLDVTLPDQVAAAAAAAPDVTLLVNNAGVLAQRGLMEATDLAPLEWEMAVNVFGLARLCQAFVPVIERNGGGAVVNMLSVASLIAFAPFGSYCASKAAAMSLTKSLRYELKDRGIGVYGVYAGYIDTGMIDNIEDEKTSPQAIARAAFDGVAAGTPDIDADERAQTIRRALQEDAPAVDRSSWDRADAFREENPL